MLGKLDYKYIVAIVGVFSIFMELIDTTIVNVAVPTSRASSTSRRHRRSAG